MDTSLKWTETVVYRWLNGWDHLDLSNSCFYRKIPKYNEGHIILNRLFIHGTKSIDSASQTNLYCFFTTLRFCVTPIRSSIDKIVTSYRVFPSTRVCLLLGRSWSLWVMAHLITSRVIRPKRIYFPEHFCYCFPSNFCVLNTNNTDKRCFQQNCYGV